MMASERVLVTGGQGFIGAWVVKQLLDEGVHPIIFDLKENNGILEQVLQPQQMLKLERHYGDISDTEHVRSLVLECKPTAIIHLAGLQIPTCKVNPVLGAQVNVIGTLNVFEAAKALREVTGGKPPMIVYASSAAVLGPPSAYTETPVPDDYYHKPGTIYGVFKLCNEGCARLYWQDHQMPSVGLRPLTCFGVGREIGLTSAPTKAIKATVLGRKYTVTCSGTTGFSYVEDVARIFVGCMRASVEGAPAFNIRGVVDTSEHFVEILKQVLPEAGQLIDIKGPSIPIMADTDESALTALLKSVPAPHDLKEPFPLPLDECIRRTAEHFKRLADEGRLHSNDLPPLE
ncbi:NAD-dependent epimerase/dehydratase [Salpingoeca rosetta]|uniref:NAD-dependent epimerase/dehydratase n=1 Tax=Salpingoeca rosetta (strain ATCC 50818 / BSB-021) TaxID=946362 RepID=F2UNP5_SALR5|nr:NAD-dependent epimerase/dehydratase [Salpingoeca rosetta]EGD79250.1 NAD-dependent epimerase/dehydratase [Salpingoeca rosetta]|eukprot:XP_004989335.1 NAD-dependent epimerase/dehydratase [Salpingoeca rosetta]